MKRTGIRIFAASLVVGAFIGGCATQNQWVAENGAALDRIAGLLDEYGSVGMSSPLLSLPDERFRFDLPNQNPPEYFKDAKQDLQARAAASQTNVDISAMSLSLQADPTQMAKYGELLRQYRENQVRYLREQAQRERLLAEKRRAAEYAVRLTLAAELEAAKAKAGVERAKLEADAYAKYAAAIQIPDAPQLPEFPTAPDNDDAHVPQLSGTASNGAEQSRAILSDGGKLTEYFKLLGDDPKVSASNRSALITAAGDTAVEAIFSALGEPDKAAAFHGKTTVFGVAMVSVQPGWRTQKDFAAHLVVRPEIEWKPARKAVTEAVLTDIGDIAVSDNDSRANSDQKISQLYKKSDLEFEQGLSVLASVKRKTGGEYYVATQMFLRNRDIDKLDNRRRRAVDPEIPFTLAAVSAVSPMTDVQNMELSSSVRSREERALRLALALRSLGIKIGANAFFEHLKQFEKDVRTRNQEVPIASFSTGNQFGYQVGPAFWGLNDPSGTQSDSGYKLTRQSFPTLILMGFEDLRPAIVYDEDLRTIQIQEPYLKFTQVRRWVPLTGQAAEHPMSEAAVLAVNTDATKAWEFECEKDRKIKILPCDDSMVDLDHIKDMVKYRGMMLSEDAFGSYNEQALPLELIVGKHDSAVTQVFPSTVQYGGGQPPLRSSWCCSDRT